MGGHVGRLVAGAAVHERQRVGDLVGIGEAVVAAACIAALVVGGIPRGGAVEGLLLVVDGGGVFLNVAKHAHVDVQQVVEHRLVHAHVAGEVAHALVHNHALVVDIAQGHAVAVAGVAAREGHVVVVLEAGVLYGLLPVGVVALVDEHEAAAGARLAIAVGPEHVEVFVHRGDACGAVVAHARCAGCAFLGGDLDHAAGAAAAIHGGLGGVAQYLEALDVGRVDARQGRQVAQHAVDDHERVVAAGERGGAAQAHGAHGGHAVVALLNGEAGHTAVDGLERVGHLLAVHAPLGDGLVVETVLERVAQRGLCLGCRAAQRKPKCDEGESRG